MNLLIFLFLIVRGLLKLWPIWLCLVILFIVALALEEKKENEAAARRAEISRQKWLAYEKKKDEIAPYLKQWPSEKEILSVTWAKKQCSTEETFHRGRQLHGLHFVKRVFVDGMHFSGRVSSSSNVRTYLCEASFDISGDILDQHCECPAFSKYPGACKHLIAMYGEMQYTDRVLINRNQIKQFTPLDLGTMIDSYYLCKTTEEGNSIALVGKITWFSSDYFELKEVFSTTIRAFSMKCYWYSKEIKDCAMRNRNNVVKVYGIVRRIATYKTIECEFDVIKIETE